MSDIEGAKNRLAGILGESEEKKTVDSAYLFLLQCKKSSTNPGDVLLFLTQFSNSLLKLSQLPAFQDQTNRTALVEFAEQAHQMIAVTLGSTYLHLNKKKMDSKLNKLERTVHEIGKKSWTRKG